MSILKKRTLVLECFHMYLVLELWLIFWIRMDNSERKDILKLNGITVTKPRMRFLKILEDLSGPISVQQIFKNYNDQFALSTLYRVVNDLAAVNIIDTFTSPDQSIWVEIKSSSGHHHHLYCESCKTVMDIEMDEVLEESIHQLRTELNKRYGIEITDHSFELYGRCVGEKHKI